MECKDIAISLIQRLLPIVTLKYITAICIFIILHILFVLLESVAQMYLTFWAPFIFVNRYVIFFTSHISWPPSPKV